MNPEQLMKQVNEIAWAEQALAKAVAEYEAVKSLGDPRLGYAIHINGIKIQVADMDLKTFSPKLVRGREMLHLGALKVTAAEVDAAKSRVFKSQEKMREMVNKASDAGRMVKG